MAPGGTYSPGLPCGRAPRGLLHVPFSFPFLTSISLRATLEMLAQAPQVVGGTQVPPRESPGKFLNSTFTLASRSHCLETLHQQFSPRENWGTYILRASTSPYDNFVQSRERNPFCKTLYCHLLEHHCHIPIMVKYYILLPYARKLL